MSTLKYALPAVQANRSFAALAAIAFATGIGWCDSVDTLPRIRSRTFVGIKAGDKTTDRGVRLYMAKC
jgi:hypothetical protein